MNSVKELVDGVTVVTNELKQLSSTDSVEVALAALVLPTSLLLLDVSGILLLVTSGAPVVLVVPEEMLLVLVPVLVLVLVLVAMVVVLAGGPAVLIFLATHSTFCWPKAPSTNRAGRANDLYMLKGLTSGELEVARMRGRDRACRQPKNYLYIGTVMEVSPTRLNRLTHARRDSSVVLSFTDLSITNILGSGQWPPMPVDAHPFGHLVWVGDDVSGRRLIKLIPDRSCSKM